MRLAIRFTAFALILSALAWLVYAWTEGDFGGVFEPFLAFLGAILGFLMLLAQRRPREPRTTDADFQRNRRQLLERVRIDWIEGVLEQSLYKVARIELGLETKPDVVESPLDVVVQRPDQEPQPLQAGTPMRSVFDDLGGQLLILGDPGTGKTTLLLELARDLLNRAKNDEYYPVPVDTTVRLKVK